jgi:hypothetical protein
MWPSSDIHHNRQGHSFRQLRSNGYHTIFWLKTIENWWNDDERLMDVRSIRMRIPILSENGDRTGRWNNSFSFRGQSRVKGNETRHWIAAEGWCWRHIQLRSLAKDSTYCPVAIEHSQTAPVVVNFRRLLRRATSFVRAECPSSFGDSLVATVVVSTRLPTSDACLKKRSLSVNLVWRYSSKIKSCDL